MRHLSHDVNVRTMIDIRSDTHFLPSKIKFYSFIAQTPSGLPDHHYTSNLHINSINLPLLVENACGACKPIQFGKLVNKSEQFGGCFSCIRADTFKDGGQTSLHLHGLNILFSCILKRIPFQNDPHGQTE